jgi:hypothetical protein
MNRRLTGGGAMTTTVRPESEWTAPPLRPTARWVPVRTADDRTRMEMVWAVPVIEVPQSVPVA